VTQLPLHDGAYLCVLASGSAGNCSILALRRAGVTRCVLIDLGLSPRRTMKLLAERGLGAHQIDAALVTHLDHDHLHPGWRSQMPGHARVLLHEAHARRLHGREHDRWRLGTFVEHECFDLDPEVSVRPVMMSHDEQGVASFRVDFSGSLGECALGYATDLGHVPARLVGHFGGDGGEGGEPEVDDDSALGSGQPRAVPRGPRAVARSVDVLAIESNYCPAMQHASDRPYYLKRRIMGGHGHLSNQEAVSAVLAIEPREHVVLLHLSRECNCPRAVAALHAGADYALTIAAQDEPTRWVRIGEGARRSDGARGLRRAAVVVPQNLWHAVAAAGSA
jgi:hypothetical protein